MRFPSIATALEVALSTARRFPWTLGAALVATATTMAAIAGPEKPWHLRLLAIAVIGLSTLTAVTTAGERAGVALARRRLLETVVAAALAALFVVSIKWPDDSAFLRFAQLLVAAHLLVAVLPYYRPGPQGGFWQFNRFLFERFLVASLYSSVLWVGLAIALAALDKLLGVTLPKDSYGHLWALLAFLFHPWFLLSGVPRDYQYLEELDDYPIGIKIFTQFVLIPLVTVHLTILLLYLGRIVITQTWPSGWIGYLVSSVSVVGVLALLLVHPIRDRADSKWVNVYGRWFFAGLLAPLVMLLMAIGKRIGQYGVTEPRYFLLVLALWGLGVALFYALTASRNIKVIPMTLAIVSLITAFGPWGAFQVSLHSQLGRLERIVVADGMGRVGALTPPTRALSLEDQKDLSGIFDYLQTHHGAGALAGAVGVPADTTPEGAMRRLGLTYTTNWERGSAGSIGFTVKQPEKVDVSGFEELEPLSLWPGGKVVIAADSLQLVADSTLRSISLVHGSDTLLVLDLGGALKERGLALEGTGGVHQTLETPVVVRGESRGLAVAVVLASGTGSRDGTRSRWSYVSGFVLMRGAETITTPIRHR